MSDLWRVEVLRLPPVLGRHVEASRTGRSLVAAIPRGGRIRSSRPLGDGPHEALHCWVDGSVVHELRLQPFPLNLAYLLASAVDLMSASIEEMDQADEQNYSSATKELSAEEEKLLQKQDSRMVSSFQSTKLESDARKYWDLFYKRNENRFFKDRHWIMREFPELEDFKSTDRRFTLLEVGCGVGNLFYPLLEEGLSLNVHACDLSPRAIELVKQNPMYDEDKINAFQADLTLPHSLADVAPIDIATMVFVLSAVHPDKFHLVVDNVYRALKPGGILFFRDYGLYDMAQLRFKPGHKIADNFYMRQDGTRSYFFSVEEVERIFVEKGFKMLSNQYVNRRTVNKKEDIDVPRIYVQAKLEKP